MCFRPGNVEKPIICAECNNRVPIVAGFKPANCPKCGAALPADDAMVPPKPASPAAPSAPAPASPEPPKTPTI